MLRMTIEGETTFHTESGYVMVEDYEIVTSALLHLH